VLEAPPADRATVIDAAIALAKSYPKAAKLPAFLQAFYAGDRTAAFGYLVALFAETSSDGGGVDYATPTITAHFRKEVQDDIDAFLRAEAPSPERAAMFYDTYVTNSARYGIGSDPATVLPFYRKLVSVDPGNLDYAVGLSRLLWQRTDHAGAAAPLRSYVDSSPTAQDAASVLQMMYAVMGQGADAEAVAQSAGVSIDDPVWLAALFNKLGSGGADRHLVPVRRRLRHVPRPLPDCAGGPGRRTSAGEPDDAADGRSGRRSGADEAGASLCDVGRYGTQRVARPLAR
jgi:hypothetical protein